jgi:hypothetical protein
MAQSITNLGAGEYATGSSPLGGYITNLGNLYTPNTTAATQSSPLPVNTSSFKASNPQVLGAGDGPTGGNKGGIVNGISYPDSQSYMDAVNAFQNGSNQVRNDINSGYDNYFSSLDSMMGGLNDQKTAQEGIVNSQFNQGKNTLTNQFDTGTQDLNTQQRKTDEQTAGTLKDLTDNIRNLFTSGQIKLGAMGAGDSSAVNQYSYALSKLGDKQRGNVLTQKNSIYNDINDRSMKLKSTYDTAVNNLQEETNAKISQIGQWFADSQNSLRQAKAQGQLQKGQDLASLSKDLLNQATQSLMQVKAEQANKRSALEQWAMNNSQSVQGLQSNLAQVSNYQAPGVGYSPVDGSLNTGGGTPSLAGMFGFGNSSQDNKDPRTMQFA